MAGSHSVRCPVCNKYGSPTHALNFCGRCVAENKQPKCIVSRCGQDAVIHGKAINRYCQEHLAGEDYTLRRDSFETPTNDPKRGWRQEPTEEFGIIKENFPITER
jgi:hypothetical protein